MIKLEQHHIRYEEIHGEDEIIMLTHNEHKKVHREDRANGFKPIPRKIQQAARARSPKGIISQLKYEKQALKYIHFSESFGLDVLHKERITYNENNGNVSYMSILRPSRGRTLPIIEVN